MKEKALQLYTYAFPLIATEVTHWGADDTIGFTHLREFPDSSETRVVRLNMDTLYSLAFTQLANTPYVAHVPKIEDRYYLFPILDAYTNVVESIGTRTPNWAEGDYILLYQDQPVPAGYENYEVIRLQDSLNSILLRIETRGKKDYNYINKYQDQFELRPLYPERLEPVPGSQGAPAHVMETISAEEFFTLFAKLSVVNPIRDPEIQKAASEFGIITENNGIISSKSEDADSKKIYNKFDYNSLDSEKREALEFSVREGFATVINAPVNPADLVISNGWYSKFTDIGSYGENYAARASVAYHGWGANIPQDSAYASSLEKLDANKKYKIHIKKDGFPHAEYFWSLTLYGEQSPVPNKIDRFAINTYDVDDGIVQRNPDGSLDIIVSREEPTDSLERKNWLPAPTEEDAFSLTIRIYWPDEFTLQGKWEAPVISEF